MQRANLILPGLLAILGAVILWQSIFQMDYFYADRGAPGPGFLPFWVSLGVVVLGLVLVVEALRSPEAGAAAEWPDAAGWLRIGFLLGGFLLLLLAVRLIGLVLASILFLACVGYLLGMRRVWILLPVSVGIGIFLHFVFDSWLRISLPDGLLGERLAEYLPWIF